jgi:UDP-N-acetyl-D-glucosamine dehydrogenase
MLRWADAVVIVTDHQAVDYQRVVDSATLIIDTRNVTATLNPGRAKVVGLASTSKQVERRRGH